MFNIDDQFLADLGLAGLPDDQKAALKQQFIETLELRVGTELSEGLSDEQLEEFESIIDRKMEVVDGWLATHQPEYRQDEGFTRMQQATGLAADDAGLRAEYTATRWLEQNRPDYRDVVARVLEGLKQEILQHSAAILGNNTPSQAA